VITLDLDQAQAGRRVLGEQGAYQGGLAGAARTPQQGMVGGQPVEELPGVAGKLLALTVDADQVGQAHRQVDLQWQQVATAAVPLPTSGQAVLPVDLRPRGR
jgi:hypothetical protein